MLVLNFVLVSGLATGLGLMHVHGGELHVLMLVVGDHVCSLNESRLSSHVCTRCVQIGLHMWPRMGGRAMPGGHHESKPHLHAGAH